MNEQQKEILANACVPKEWWDNCFISNEGKIFTPLFDIDNNNNMLKTGTETYNEWKSQSSATQ